VIGFVDVIYIGEFIVTKSIIRKTHPRVICINLFL